MVTLVLWNNCPKWVSRFGTNSQKTGLDCCLFKNTIAKYIAFWLIRWNAILQTAGQSSTTNSKNFLSIFLAKTLRVNEFDMKNFSKNLSFMYKLICTVSI